MTDGEYDAVIWKRLDGENGWALGFLRWLARFTVVVCATVLAVAVILGILRAVLPAPVIDATTERVLRTVVGEDGSRWCAYGWRFPLPSTNRLCGPFENLDTREEAIAAYSRDNRTVQTWVTRCVPSLTVARLDASELNDEDWTALQIRPVTSGILWLSGRIADDRAALASNARRSERDLRFWTWITVLVGLVTTVLVGLGSTEVVRADSGPARAIRATALVFTAIGTAVAALTAFYAPREELARSNLTLSALQRLHGNIANEMWAIPCPQETGGDPSAPPTAAERHREWTVRYRDIMFARDGTAQGGPDRDGPPGSGGGGRPATGAPPASRPGG